MKYTLKHQQVTPLPLEKEPRLKEICDRLSNLRSCSLDPFEVEIVNLLKRNVVLTPLELEYLVNIEKRHNITQSPCSPASSLAFEQLSTIGKSGRVSNAHHNP